jgi:putative endonuclease
VDRHYYVYIFTNPLYTVLYTGFTSNLEGRIIQHRNGLVEGFTRRYNVYRLVYCEESPTVWDAIRREKEIKGWARARKIELIESVNPGWYDLAERWFEDIRGSPAAPDSSELRMTVDNGFTGLAGSSPGGRGRSPAAPDLRSSE